MFKLEFAVVFVVLFACSCYPSPLAEEQAGEISADEGPRALSDEYVRDAFAEEDDDGPEEWKDEKVEDENDFMAAMNKSLPTAKPAEDPRWIHRCGGRWFYPSRYICCAGFRRWTGGYLRRCCGTKVYNPRSTICCAGVIRIKPTGIPGCCGTRAFNARWKKCIG